MQCTVGLVALVKQKYYANNNNSHCSGMVWTVEREFVVLLFVIAREISA